MHVRHVHILQYIYIYGNTHNHLFIFSPIQSEVEAAPAVEGVTLVAETQHRQDTAVVNQRVHVHLINIQHSIYYINHVKSVYIFRSIYTSAVLKVYLCYIPRALGKYHK